MIDYEKMYKAQAKREDRKRARSAKLKQLRLYDLILKNVKARKETNKNN